jgi:hypothetical protein
VGNSWCQIMHPDPMWPVNGEYQCRVCQRKFPVAWERQDTKSHTRPSNVPVSKPETAPATVSQSY